MLISNKYFDGERPLYESRDVELHRVTIGEGESGLKESRGVKAIDCRFEGMYVLWECEDVECKKCTFSTTDRAPMWYGKNYRLWDCRIDAPKAFRELENIIVKSSKISDGIESFWHCVGGRLSNIEMLNADYAFLHSKQFEISNLRLQGKYAFQYTRDAALHGVHQFLSSVLVNLGFE